jgi:HK97 family phage major capsid protein
MSDELRGDVLAWTDDDLVGLRPEVLEQRMRDIDAHLVSLSQDEQGALRDLSEDEDVVFNRLVELRDKAKARLDKHASLKRLLDTRPAHYEATRTRMFGEEVSSLRTASRGELRDRALRILDNRHDTAHMTDEQRSEVNKAVRRDFTIGARIIVTENEAYRSAWMKLITDPHAAATLDDDERNAVRAWHEYRAMSENASGSGGYGIPVFIDPSIIETAQGSDNPFLQICRQVTTPSNIWKGVASAGVTWAFGTEASVATDNSPTLTQPQVTVHMAKGFIPYTIEVADDYPAFADEMSRLLSDGWDELQVDKYTRGSGSGEPYGILTVLSANTNVRVTVTTVGTIGQPDPYKVWKAVPQRFRRNAKWLMSVGVNNAFRQLGTDQFHSQSVNITEEWAESFFRKPVYESPYMPDTTASTTAPTGLAVVGDFQNFVLARRGGMEVELVPQLFQQQTAGTGVGFPTGQRGWFAHARIGSASTNDLAFRLLVNS